MIKEETTNQGSSEAPEGDIFIDSAFKGKNSFWGYLIMIVIAFLSTNIIGAITFFILNLFYVLKGNVPDQSTLTDPSALGVSPVFYLALMILPFVAGLLTVILMMKPLHLRSFGTVINGGRAVRWKRMILSSLVWLSMSGIYLLITIRTDPSNYIINNTSSSLISLALVSFLLIPFQAAFEEILFRGYLMQGFAMLTRSRWMAIIITSLFFALMHGLNPEVRAYGFWVMMPQYFLFGLIFAIMSMIDGGIEIAIGAHAANNAFLSVFLTNKDSVLQTPALYEQIRVYPWQDFAGTAISGILFLLVMMIIFKWGNFGLLYKKVIKP